MAKWINRTVVQAPRNGTTSHTIAFTAASAGNLLVLVMEGAVTHTVPTGWTRRNQALNNTELSVYTKTATSGESSFTTTHNGSNYPVGAVIYEFAAGSTWVNGVSATGLASPGGANPTLSGLSGTNLLMAASATGKGAGNLNATSGVWNQGVEDVDQSVPYSTTDGYWLGIVYVEDSTATSFAPTVTLTNPDLQREGLTFAVKVAAVTPPKQGSGAGAWSFTGSGSGTRPARARAEGAWSTSGSSSSARSARGRGDSAWATQGASRGTRPARGAAAGSWTTSGAAAGAHPASGRGAGAWSTIGTGLAVRTARGAGLGAWVTAGTASSYRTATGRGSGLLAWAGTGTGTAPSEDSAAGGGSGSWSFAGASYGRRAAKGTAAGTTTTTGAGRGRRTASGTGTGATATTGTAAGARTSAGAGVGQVQWVGRLLADTRDIAVLDVSGPRGRPVTATLTGRAARASLAGRPITITGPRS